MTRQKRVFSRRAVETLCCVLGLASVALVSSCTSGPPPTATINYKEVSVCGGSTDGTVPNLVVLVFEITSISNEGSNAVTFNFNPQLLYMKADDPDPKLNSGGVDHASTSEQGNPGSLPGGSKLNPGSTGLTLSRAPFGGYAREQTVAAGSTVTVNAGVVVLEVVTPGGPAIPADNTTDFHLLYAPPSGSEGVLLLKANGSVTDSPAVESWGCQTFA